VQGLPGYREQITKGEIEIKTEQSMGIFDSIGTEIEGGAVNVGYALYETMVLNWNDKSIPSPTRVLGENPFTIFLEKAPLSEKKQFLKENCDVRIVGISAQLQRQEKLKMMMAAREYAESAVFAEFFKRKELLQDTFGLLGMYNPRFLKTDKELEQSQMGTQLAEVLGKLAASGGPEVKARVQEFINSVLGGGGIEIGGAGPAPVPPTETTITQ
jgi:hypothetical protein